MKTRWTRVVAVAAFAALPTVAASAAWADGCPPLELNCFTGDALDGAEVEDPVETVTDTVNETVETVEPVVQDTVGGVVGGGGTEPPPEGGGGNGGPDGNGGPAGNGDGGNGGPDGNGGADGDSGHVRRGGALLGVDAPISSSTSAREGFGAASVPLTETTPEPHDRPGLSEHFAAAAAGAAKSLATVLVLLGAAVGFVTIQERLDRKDPRLALAPLRSDVVRFE